MKKVLALTFIVSSFATGACGKKSKSDDVATGSLQMGLRLAGTASTTAKIKSAVASDFRNSIIASGAPSEMKFTIKKMTLTNTSGQAFTIYTNTDGKEITAKSGLIDISEMFTRYACVNSKGDEVPGVECPCGLDSANKPVEKGTDGKCPAPAAGSSAPEGIVQVQEGTFSSLTVEFGVAAKMKGCVTGNFSTVQTNVSGSHTYCTTTDKHTFQASGGGTRSDFEIASSAATEMLVQLNKTNSVDTDSTKTFSQEYKIAGNIEIKKDSTARLTMVIDNNRMLRFFNDNDATANHKTPNPGMLSQKSYFFNTVFEESSFVFVGKSGDIRGFQWWTEACNATPKPTDRICTGSTEVVAGWMTIVKDADGKPLVLGLMPDDDNALTIVKGSNKSSTGIDQSKFTLTTGTTYNAGFTLGTDGSGTIYGINVDDSVGNTQTGTFESSIQSNSYYGKIYLKRGL